MIKPYLFSLALFLMAVSLQAQLTFRIVSTPEYTPDAAAIYAVGSFNGWEPVDNDFKLTQQQDGVYTLTITPPVGEVKYKFTRGGGWSTVEGNANGAYLSDRVLNYTGEAKTETIVIQSWEDLHGNSGGGSGDNSTAAENVHTIENFYIPELNTSRRIWVYLPPDYATSNRDYPVLYMHDAQNVFDLYSSFSGEWRVDESLNAMFAEGDAGVIVIGVENGGGSRIDEYTPWPNAQYGGGEGAKYAAFLVNTLKPYVDSNYRTRPEREATGIMGSSLGGLITMYTAMEYQEVFSKAGVFSPSFWWSDEAYQHVRNEGKRANMKIYFLAGEQESESMVLDMQAMYNVMREIGFSESELFFRTHPDGQHSEGYWAREFPGAYYWLFSGLSTNVQSYDEPAIKIRITPNPATNLIQIIAPQSLENATAHFYTLDGRLVTSVDNFENNTVDVSSLSNGMYLVLITKDCMPLANQKLVIER